MKEEPGWMKSISNETVCNYFYVMFFVMVVYAGIVIAITLWSAKKYPMVAGRLFATLPFLVIGILNPLFAYLVCARSISK